MPRWATVEGAPFPQGVTWIEDEQAYNFALYSKHADSVTLLLYRAEDAVHPVVTYRLDYLKHKSWRIWHCRLPKAALHGAQYYAYVVAGPRPGGVLSGTTSIPKRSSWIPMRKRSSSRPHSIGVPP